MSVYYCHRGIAEGDIRDLPRQRGSRAYARPFGSRLSAEVADIFISLARNENSAMTVVWSRESRG